MRLFKSFIGSLGKQKVPSVSRVYHSVFQKVNLGEKYCLYSSLIVTLYSNKASAYNKYLILNNAKSRNRFFSN